MEVVRFCFKDANYGFLSNFYLCDIEFNGLNWRSVEHCYQAMKFYDDNIIQEIRNCKTALQCRRLANQHKNKVISGFYDYSNNYNLMLYITTNKFVQNKDLLDMLIGTGNSKLIENTKDEYWGIGKSNNGMNIMGEILEKIRCYSSKAFNNRLY